MDEHCLALVPLEYDKKIMAGVVIRMIPCKELGCIFYWDNDVFYIVKSMDCRLFRLDQLRPLFITIYSQNILNLVERIWQLYLLVLLNNIDDSQYFY